MGFCHLRVYSLLDFINGLYFIFKCFLSIPVVPRVFISNSCNILSNAFSASLRMIFVRFLGITRSYLSCVGPPQHSWRKACFGHTDVFSLLGCLRFLHILSVTSLFLFLISLRPSISLKDLGHLPFPVV